MNVTLRKSLMEADMNAKNRDFHKQVNVNHVAEQEKKANQIGFGLYKIKNKNKCPFAQDIVDNFDCLNEANYLTTAEYGMIQRLKPLVNASSNEIVDRKTKHIMNVTQIAKYLNSRRETISRNISSLIDKGILFEVTDKDTLKAFGRTVTERPLVFNPELVYNGDKNYVDDALVDLLLNNDQIEKNDIHLYWKVFRRKGERYGKFYTRKTYLKYKGE